MQTKKIPRRNVKAKYDPYNTTNLSRQVKTVIVAALGTSFMLAAYTAAIGYYSSLKPDISAMLLDGIIMTTLLSHLSNERLLVFVISGGASGSSTSIELFMPSRRSQCSLPDLPLGVTGHSFNRLRANHLNYSILWGLFFMFTLSSDVINLE